jgi:hypothetical protein
MHTSLTPRTNILLSLLSATIIGISLLASTPPHFPVLLPFALMGLVAGILQARAVRAAPATFRAAESWFAVRRALTSSFGGKLSVLLLWCNGFAVVALVLFSGKLSSLPTVVSAYASFILFRELATLRAIRALSSTQPLQ